MKVHFIDVGQGDCTLIEDNGHYALIVAGPEGKGTAIRNYMKKQGVTKLDYLILTHTDADHIGSAASVISNVTIDTIFMGNFPKDNKVYSGVLNELNYKSLKWSTPTVGDTYALGNGSFTIIAPNKSTYDNPNASSIGILLSFGNNKFLFTGDCEEASEKEIINNGIDIKADVYQVGHHGSKTSSSQSFMDKVKPTYAVISCASGNAYGHPHAETLNRFRTMGINTFRTDEQGTIICESDGNNLTWNCMPSTTWLAGEPTVSELSTDTKAIPTQEIEQSAVTQTSGSFVVNGKNGKIHIVGACSATKAGSKSFMKEPVYFDSYEKALEWSRANHPGQDKPKCGNCYK